LPASSSARSACPIARRRAATTFMEASKRTLRFLPSSFARYMAVSAQPMSASISWASSGYVAMPTLHVSATGWPSSEYGDLNISTMRRP